MKIAPTEIALPSNYEITVLGRKLLGSAQARRKEGVLQHGSLPLTGDLKRVTSVLAYHSAAARATAGERLLQRAGTIQDLTGLEIAWKMAAEAFIAAFQEALNLELEHEELTPDEQRQANLLHQQKYTNPTWNLKL